MGLFLFIIAYVLFLPITIFNALNVRKRGYLKDSAVNLDRYANREFRFSLNKYLITEKSPDRFGNIEETISSVLGKNQLSNNLTRFGKVIVWILNKIEKNHCIKSINK
jgi:hypothetical protein